LSLLGICKVTTNFILNISPKKRIYYKKRLPVMDSQI
jgi:hypothetical protein